MMIEVHTSGIVIKYLMCHRKHPEIDEFPFDFQYYFKIMATGMPYATTIVKSKLLLRILLLQLSLQSLQLSLQLFVLLGGCRICFLLAG